MDKKDTERDGSCATMDVNTQIPFAKPDATPRTSLHINKCFVQRNDGLDGRKDGRTVAMTEVRSWRWLAMMLAGCWHNRTVEWLAVAATEAVRNCD